MDFTLLDNELLEAVFGFWFYVIMVFIFLRLAWLLYEKFLSIFQR